MNFPSLTSEIPCSVSSPFSSSLHSLVPCYFPPMFSADVHSLHSPLLHPLFTKPASLHGALHVASSGYELPACLPLPENATPLGKEHGLCPRRGPVHGRHSGTPCRTEGQRGRTREPGNGTMEGPRLLPGLGPQRGVRLSAHCPGDQKHRAPAKGETPGHVSIPAARPRTTARESPPRDCRAHGKGRSRGPARGTSSPQRLSRHPSQGLSTLGSREGAHRPNRPLPARATRSRVRITHWLFRETSQPERNAAG